MLTAAEQKGNNFDELHMNMAEAMSRIWT